MKKEPDCFRCGTGRGLCQRHAIILRVSHAIVDYVNASHSHFGGKPGAKEQLDQALLDAFELLDVRTS